MWASLLAAGFLGLLAGFGARGFFVSNRVRRAEVDRDVAQTELQQSRAELDDLYAAQRKHKDANSATGDTREDELLRELNSRDATINNLSTALNEARDDLKKFAAEQEKQSEAGEALAGAAIAGGAVTAVAAAVGQDPDDHSKVSELSERNTWLEERVAGLEAELSNTAPAETIAATAAADTVTTPDMQKLSWQNSYLRQRVEALETSLVERESEPEMVEREAPVLTAVPDVPAQDENAAPSESDEELARLRWRNRYLEGRLAYYEEGQSAGDEVEEAAVASVTEPEVTETEAPVQEPVEAVAEDESVDAASAEMDRSEQAEPAVEPADEEGVEASHPSDAVLQELGDELDVDAGLAQPFVIERPADGGDDLTAIGGVGPRIATVLNELGIWTYSQIAEWGEENERWVDDHLAFNGRVDREGWVSQAKALVESAAQVDA